MKLKIITIAIVLNITTLMLNDNCMAASKININHRYTIPEYTANYKIYWHNIMVGSSTHTVTQLTSNRYLAAIVTTPVAKWLPFGYTESSEFGIENNKIIPHQYEFAHKEHGSLEHGILRFDWQSRQIQNITTAQNIYALTDNMHDKLSHIFQLQADLRRQHPVLNYQVVKADDISIYQFKILGEEIINTPLGKLTTIKLEHKTAGSNRKTIFWLAKSLNLTVAQSQQYKNNKLTAKLVITDYTLN